MRVRGCERRQELLITLQDSRHTVMIGEAIQDRTMLQDLQVNDEHMNGGTGLMTYVAYHLLSAVSSLRVGGVGRGRPSFDICRDKRHGACIPIELLLLLLGRRWGRGRGMLPMLGRRWRIAGLRRRSLRLVVGRGRRWRWHVRVMPLRNRRGRVRRVSWRMGVRKLWRLLLLVLWRRRNGGRRALVISRGRGLWGVGWVCRLCHRRPYRADVAYRQSMCITTRR